MFDNVFDLSRVEAFEAKDLSLGGEIAECLMQRAARIDIGIPVEAHENDWLTAEFTDGIASEQNTCRIGPMQVVEHDQQRRFKGRAAEERRGPVRRRGGRSSSTSPSS